MIITTDNHLVFTYLVLSAEQLLSGCWSRLVWEPLTTIRVVKILLVLMGSLVVWLSLTAWRRNKSSAMFFLAVGFSLVTAGSVAAGILFEFLNYELLEVNIAEGVVQLLGFAMIIYSVYGRST